MDRPDFTPSRSEQWCLAQMELPTPVDSASCQFMFGLLLKVVSEVDEMGLFHQLGFDNREYEWPQSTIALLSGLRGDTHLVAYVDDGTVFGGR